MLRQKAGWSDEEVIDVPKGTRFQVTRMSRYLGHAGTVHILFLEGEVGGELHSGIEYYLPVEVEQHRSKSMLTVVTDQDGQ